MKNQLKQTNKRTGNYSYVEGNTVKKLSAVPVREPRYDEAPLRRTSRTVKRNRQKALSMNGPYVLFLAVAAVICLVMCSGYLMIQASNMKLGDDIASMEKSVDKLATQNDSVDYSINSYVDINHIIQVATQELGMVKATKANVELYQSTEREYINQYKDIPNK